MTCKFASYPNYTPHIGRSISLLPEGWVFKKLGYLSSDGENAFVDGPFGSDLKSSEYTDFGTPLIQLNNIKVGSHCLINLKFIPEDKRNQLRRHIARAGDIIIAKMADPVARAAIVSDKYDEYVIVADCVKLTLNEALIDPKYAIYAINSKGVNADAVQASTGTTRIRINLSELKKLSVPYPPLVLQRTIAAFLDYETARLDSLIDKQQRLIELLKEKRQAVISHAVTKGLNPNAPMKDSGVEWLGQVPEHWVVTKVGLNTVKIGSGKTPKGGADVYQESGVIFIRSQNVYDDGLRISETECCFITEETHNDMISTLVRPNDVLLNITGGSIGRSCLVPVGIGKANVNQHVCILRFKVGLPKYMAFFMTSDCIQEQISVLQVGGNREGLNFEQISNMKICIPPADEVSEICNYLESYRFKNECLMLKASSLIELLKERRNSVISAAVTGKIDLRGWRPPVRDPVA